jgi:hypothetical protein
MSVASYDADAHQLPEQSIGRIGLALVLQSDPVRRRPAGLGLHGDDGRAADLRGSSRVGGNLAFRLPVWHSIGLAAGNDAGRTTSQRTPTGTTLILLNGEPLISFVLTTV